MYILNNSAARLWIFLLLVVVLGIGIGIVGCGAPRLAEAQKEMSEEGIWRFGDSMTCTINVTDTVQTYNVCMLVEHDVDYVYQNIYLLIKTKFPDGQVLSKPLSIELADNLGNWKGDCGSSHCKRQLCIQENAHFNQLGNHEFVIAPYMRSDTIVGIKEVAFWVEAHRVQ